MKRILFLSLMLCANFLWAQDVKYVDDPVAENKLNAQTKQLNQFIRRFNGEEDRKGTRLYEGDKGFRAAEMRKNFLDGLFDNQNFTITPQSKSAFTDYIVNEKPQFLDLHNGNWFAELKADFKYKGKTEEISIFLEFEEEGQGYQWVITHVYSKNLNSFAEKKELKSGEILHPMSHEIDFMNMGKAFQKPENVAAYTSKKYHVDLLSVFITLIKQKTLEFDSVKELKFHFFQINDYYFQISEFTRDQLNAGWLISNLVKIPENEKTQFIKIIRHENF